MTICCNIYITTQQLHPHWLITMSKEGRVRGAKGPVGDKSSVPYSTITRRERSRKLAQKRRDVYKKIMDDMTDVRKPFMYMTTTSFVSHVLGLPLHIGLQNVYECRDSS